jgi:hypothetical protein
LVEPNSRVDLVDDGGGGGFCSCEAVGARDWRIEYVRCMMMAVLFFSSFPYFFQQVFVSCFVGL